MRPVLVASVLLAAACSSRHAAAVSSRTTPTPSTPVGTSPSPSALQPTPTPSVTPSPVRTAAVVPVASSSPSASPHATAGPVPHLTPSPARTTRPAPKTVQLSMRSGNSFAPASLTLNVGDSVTVTNTDLTPLIRHNWTDMGVFMSGDLPYGAHYTYRFTRAGGYAYECTIHQPEMVGTITVR